INALPLLGDDPFLVVNGDIWCDFDFTSITELSPQVQAHLVLVENPGHNHKGDFSLKSGMIKNTGEPMYTFSGIGIYSKDFFSGQESGISPLAPLIRSKCEENLVSGQLHEGRWTDVGTIERLQELDIKLSG
ncbi:MAG: mannose-1-phosphate guanylyltransferase, partial [Gammaproteobacteria bacterium]|nr:mannose-1-phosphate guanylyltransferase [Gammaproteobacteria bacterium]